MKSTPLILLSIALLTLGGCKDDAPTHPTASEIGRSIETKAPTVTSSATAPVAAPLAPDGIDDLTLGQPVPRNSVWKAAGAQVSDACMTYSSPKHPEIYAMVEGGKVQRITVKGNEGFKTAEGIGIGSTEAAVRKAYLTFAEEPHKYADAPAKYLTSPDAKDGKPGLRFEIGGDGTVHMIHFGLRPALEYVEGCA